MKRDKVPFRCPSCEFIWNRVRIPKNGEALCPKCKTSSMEDMTPQPVPMMETRTPQPVPMMETRTPQPVPMMETRTPPPDDRPVFFLIAHQEGGCDYTIGCGMATLTFWARDIDEAIRLAPSKAFDRWGEDNVNSLQILQGAPVDIDLKPERKRRNQEKEEEANDEKESRRQMFEELRKEFGP